MSCSTSLSREQFCQRIQTIAEIPEKDFLKLGFNADLSLCSPPKKKFFFLKRKVEWAQRQGPVLEVILKICEEHLTQNWPLPYWSSALARLERKCVLLGRFPETKTTHTYLLERCSALRSKTLTYYPVRVFEHPKNDFLRFAMRLSFDNDSFLLTEISRLIHELGSLEDLPNILDRLYRIILLGGPKSVQEKKIFSESVSSCFQTIYERRIHSKETKAFLNTLFSSQQNASLTSAFVMEKWLGKGKAFLSSLEGHHLEKRLSQIVEKAEILQFFYCQHKEILNCASLLKLKSYKYLLMEALFFDLGTYILETSSTEKVLFVCKTLDYFSPLEDILLLGFRKNEGSFFRIKLFDLLQGSFFSHERQKVEVSLLWKKVMKMFCKSPDQFLCQLKFACPLKDEKINNCFKQLLLNENPEGFPAFFFRCFFHPPDFDSRELLLKRFSNASSQTSLVLAQALTGVGESTFFSYNFCPDMLQNHFLDPLMALYIEIKEIPHSALKKSCLELFCILLTYHVLHQKYPQFPLSKKDFKQMFPLLTPYQRESIARRTVDSAFFPFLSSAWISMFLDIAPSVSFRNVFNRPEMNDIKICCNEQSFFVHSGILKRMSEFFAVMLEGNFKEKAVTEIEIEDFELFDFVKKWLELFDQGDPDFSPFPLEEIIDLLSVADYFQMPIFEAVNQFLSDAFAKMGDKDLYLFLASIFSEDPLEDFKEFCPAKAKDWLDPLWIYPCFHNLQERFQKFGALQSE